MSESTAPAKRQWSSRFAFLMATIGAAVGLGNLWRFPFQAGENGGSAFVLIYLVSIVIIVYPAMMGELAVGRRKGLSAIGSTREIAKEAGRSPLWGIVGLVGVCATFMILTIYSVIAGRIMAYSVMAFAGAFVEGGAGSQSIIYNGTGQAIAWQTLFMVITIAIVMRGLRGGIERFTVILMPLFFIMLAGLCFYALTSGAGGKAIDYLFTPRFSEVTPQIIMAAFGQAFFSVAVGGAAMLTYGAFLSKDENIASNGAIIAGADTMVAIVAGLMIFPIVFAFSLNPAEGMGLIFSAMPAAFATMPFGSFVGGLFFFLAFIGALTSSISMLMLATVVGEEQLKMKRQMSVLVLGSIAWAIGVASVLMPDLSEWIDFAAGEVAMPIGGILIAIFAGWIAPRTAMREELSGLSDTLFKLWRFVVRFLAPIGVSVVLVLGLMAHFNH